MATDDSAKNEASDSGSAETAAADRSKAEASSPSAVGEGADARAGDTEPRQATDATVDERQSIPVPGAAKANSDGENARATRAGVFRRLANFLAASPYARALAVSLLALAVIAVLGLIGTTSLVVLWANRLTTTVTASTESFDFTTPETGASWSLPPGRFSAFANSDSTECENEEVTTSCSTGANTQLTISGPSTVVFQVSPSGSWTVSVEVIPDEKNWKQPRVEILDVNEHRVLGTDQLLSFRALDAEQSFRIPFVATSVVLGADLHQTTSVDESEYDLWQPVLLDGEVTMVSDNKPGTEKYEVLRERLDPGDVVRIGDPSTNRASEEQQPIWGMLTAGHSDVLGVGSSTTVFAVVMHTSANELLVRRFGAPEGHSINAAGWSIAHLWPNAQSTWVVFVSLLLIGTFVLQLGEAFEKRRAPKLSSD